MKVALITGGSRGIGAATVEQFAKNGYTVILNYNASERQAQELRQRLISENCDVPFVQSGPFPILLRCPQCSIGYRSTSSVWTRLSTTPAFALQASAGRYRAGVRPRNGRKRQGNVFLLSARFAAAVKG